MKNITRLFKLLQLTRSKQLDYGTHGITTKDSSGLGEHHYQVILIAWRLALLCKHVGAKISVERVLEHALTHDLGELFGSDIGMPYAAANPTARKHAKAFEAANEEFLSRFFDDASQHLSALNQEVLKDGQKTDEAIIAKLADYLEHMNFLFYIGKWEPGRVRSSMGTKKVEKLITTLSDAKAKKVLREWFETWKTEFEKETVSDILART